MPIKKLLSAFAPGEDDNWKSMKVTYTPEEREATVTEVESILSRYNDISDIQKHKIINKFSQVMWWEKIYDIDPRHWSEVADLINPSTLFYIESDIRREIFHDLDNKFINYDNTQELYGYIDDVLWVTDDNELDTITDKNPSLIDKIRSKLSWVEKITNPIFTGKVYFDETLPIYQVYGSSYLNTNSKWSTPEIIPAYKIAEKKSVNIKYIDGQAKEHVCTYVKWRRNVIKLFKKQWVEIKKVRTEEEATLYLKEFLTPYKDQFPELLKEPNWFRFHNSQRDRDINKLISELNLHYLLIDFFGDVRTHNDCHILLPILLEDGHFVSICHDSFSLYYSVLRSDYDLIADFR